MQHLPTPEQFKDNIEKPGQCSLGTNCSKNLDTGKCEKCEAFLYMQTNFEQIFRGEGKQKIYG